MPELITLSRFSGAPQAPAAISPAPAFGSVSGAPFAYDSEGPILHQIMPLAGLALWEAWSDSLELIDLDTGSGAQSSFALDPAQRQPGSQWSESVYPPDREKLEAYLASADPAQRMRSIDYRLIVGEGELVWVRHWLLSRSPVAQGRRRLRGLLMAIPERKHLEWECLRVSERECNRIGQELHDDLCQVLAGVTFMMRVVGQRAGQPGFDAAAELNELNHELTGATNRVRSMAHGLFPAKLNHSTLRRALRDFARQTKLRFPIEITLDLPRKLTRHSPEQIMHIYRIAQESVSNSVRHGNATAIRIVVAESGSGAQMIVEDNGTGFPITIARPEGIGMHVMQYRAKMLGGELRFRNLPHRGAAVELAYPNTPYKAPRRPRPAPSP